MAPPCYITILGTVSAVPTQTRNHSSLAFTLPNGDTWLFDCGEATQLQIQKTGGGVKMGRINRIFITHMHGDHIFGLPALMATRMNGAGGSENDPRVLSGPIPADIKPVVELYGPVGLRKYLRESFRLTYSRLDGFYVVHELHPAISEPSSSLNNPEERYEKELPGRDIYPDTDGIWRDITLTSSKKTSAIKKKPTDKEWTIDAGPILHTVPSMGFVLTEPPLPGTVPPSYKTRLLENLELFKQQGVKNPLSLLSMLEHGVNLPDGTRLEPPPTKPGRKIVILGDTCDPSPITTAAMDADVLIHEATNAFLKQDEIENTKGGYQGVEVWSISRGHSTPEMAGRFARRIKLGSKARAHTSIVGGSSKDTDGGGKGCLLLNHFSSRYADPRVSEEAAAVMEEIRVCGENGFKQQPAPAALEDKLDAAHLEPQDSEQEVAAYQPADIDVICTHDCMRLEIRAAK